MPVLDEADLADLRQVITDLSEGSVVVYRAGTAGGGTAKVTTFAAVGTVAMTLVPAPLAGNLRLPDAGIAGGRVDWVGYGVGGDDVRAGDEVRSGTARYKVVGSATLQPGLFVHLSEMRS